MGTKKLELFKCQVCANLVEVITPGEGELVCCSKPMVKIEENIAQKDNTHYAHIEFYTDEKGNEIKDIVIKHVMTKEHHIEFIEIISSDGKFIKRKCLKEDETAKVTLKCDCKDFYVRLHCNVDGCWVTKY